jgi:hypothetical protein
MCSLADQLQLSRTWLEFRRRYRRIGPLRGVAWAAKPLGSSTAPGEEAGFGMVAPAHICGQAPGEKKKFLGH